MAADSSINETKAAVPPGEDKPLAAPPASGSPLRPPRPAKRASGSVRIPLPSAVAQGSKLNGAARADLAGKPAALVTASAQAAVTSHVPSSTPAMLTSHAPSSAPAVATTDAPAALVVDELVLDELDSGTPTPVPTARSASTRAPAAIVMPAVPNDPAANIEFDLTRRSSGAPPLSFDSIEVHPSDRAPAAPFTPWRDVPVLKLPSELDISSDTEAEENHDREDTIVGQVSKSLLDLSSEDEDDGENTRAYQAPQELIDLARRQREEQRHAQAGSGQKRDPKAAFVDSLSPAARKEVEQGDQRDNRTATVPIATSPSGDGAPAVDLSRPAPAKQPAKGARGKQPSLSELAREISERQLPESPPAHPELSRDVPPMSALTVSGFRTPWFTRARVWALLISVFLVAAYALARWRGLDPLH